MPRLLIDGTALEPHPKGVGRYSAHLIEQLTHRLPKDWAIQVMVGGTNLWEFTGPNAPKFIKVPPRPALFKGLVILPFLAAQQRSDVVLIPMDDAGWTGRRPLLSVVHGISERINAVAERERAMATHRMTLNWLREVCRRSMLRHSSVVVCNSYYVASEVSTRYGIKEGALRIGYCGVDERFYSADPQPIGKYWPTIDRWRGYVLSFATGDAHERYTLCPSIFAKVRQQSEGVGFVIAGVDEHAEYTRFLRKELAAQGLREGKDVLIIPFLGESRFAELRALYRGADFYLEMSAEEGFGMQLAEAMSTGTTCISSGRGALDEVGGGFPVAFDYLEASCVAEKIVSCYGLGLHQRDNQAQVAFTRRYSWNNVGRLVAEELLQLYDLSTRKCIDHEVK